MLNGSFFLNINGSGTKDDPTLPYNITAKTFMAGSFAAEARTRKPCTSPRGNTDLDKLAIGWPYADKSNIARRGHAQDRHCGTNVWRSPYKSVQSKAEKFDHPTGFPVEPSTRCIKVHGLRPDLMVLDPFLGAGTTLVAAPALGRRSIGIEVDRKYVGIAIQRLKEAKGQLA